MSGLLFFTYPILHPPGFLMALSLKYIQNTTFSTISTDTCLQSLKQKNLGFSHVLEIRIRWGNFKVIECTYYITLPPKIRIATKYIKCIIFSVAKYMIDTVNVIKTLKSLNSILLPNEFKLGQVLLLNEL